jgi:hypothetical protein
MKSASLFTVWILSVIAISLAVPIEHDNTRDGLRGNSLGRQLGEAVIWILRGGLVAGLTVGSVSYGATWLHRFRVKEAKRLDNMATWEDSQTRREIEHVKQLHGLDISLDIVKNYKNSIGKEMSNANQAEQVDDE